MYLGTQHTAEEIRKSQDCHGFTERDGFAHAGAKAWHGLGFQLADNASPDDAWKAAYPWNVVQTGGVSGIVESAGGATRFSTEEYRLLIREDTGEVFTCTTDGYAPFQNSEGCELAYALAANSGGRAVVESAGSIKGGRRCWLLLKGKEFEPRAGDTVLPYFLLAWSHDQSLAVCGIPTTIRVVCKNTQEAAVATGKRGRIISLKHSGSMDQKIAEARRCMDQWAGIMERYESAAGQLARREMRRDEIQALWTRVYCELENDGKPIASNPTTKAEREARDEAANVLSRWSRNFDEELKIAGATAWNAMNAATRWYDHQRAYRGKDHAARQETRINAALFGQGAEAKARIMAAALATV